MSAPTVTSTIRYIGVDDKTIDLFESQYPVPNGVSYNSYAILDQKLAILDTVDPRGTEQWLKNLEQTLAGRQPDYLVVSHMEPDHAGNIQRLCEMYPNLQVVGKAKTFTMIVENVGLALALEAGLAEVAHDVVARQDADDISVPERFATQLPLIAAGYDLVGSAIQEFDDEADTDGLVRRQPSDPEQIRRAVALRDPFNHPSVVYRAAAVRAVGGYQPLDLMEDYWLFARMIHHGVRATNVSRALVRYRVGAGAYARRGGLRLLRSELDLQARMRRAGVITTSQYARNLAVRASYRLVPTAARQAAYRAAQRVLLRRTR